MKNSLQIFQDKKIRSQWNEDESQWYFSVVDIVAVLTDSLRPKDYWYRVKTRTSEESKIELSTICRRLKLEALDGKMRLTDCANTKGIFRIIQSIPSPKAEPFKLWLAQVGHERIQEIEDPELAQERMKKMYEQKGYSKHWIDKRLRGMAIRQNLTDECDVQYSIKWLVPTSSVKERGIENKKDYAILTAEISRATFGMTPSEYKKHKHLPEKSKANLRDNMTDLELIFTMLGEKVTTEISESEKPETFIENKNVANRGGRVAGNARKETENELGRSIISPENFLKNPESQEKLI